jgi:predicted transcriptional regulator
MARSIIISIRISLELAQRLEKLARALECPRNYVAMKALEEYVESEEEALESIRRGLADLDAGRSVAYEKVEPRLRGLGRGKAGRPPQSRAR